MSLFMPAVEQQDQNAGKVKGNVQSAPGNETAGSPRHHGCLDLAEFSQFTR